MTTPTNTYMYQRPSSAATRAIISDNKPAEQASSSSTDVDTGSKPILQRQTTDNYARAAAEATKANTFSAAAGSGADATTDGGGRPAVQRQQSWKMSDFKGEKQGQLLGGVAGQGYSSTGG